MGLPGLTRVQADNRYSRPRGGNRFGILGDSIAAGVPFQVDYTTGDLGMGWFNQACILSGGRMRHVRNGGVPGDTTAQMLARIDSSILAYGLDWCFIGPSINDISQAVPQATTIANLDAIVRKLRAKGIEPIGFSVLPNNNGPGTYHAATNKMNLAWSDYCARHGIIYLDFYGICVDPATAGVYKAGYGETVTTPVHPSTTVGHAAIAASVVSRLLPQIQLSPFYLPLDDTDATNILNRGLFTAGTGGIPTGWASSGTGTGTRALVADSNIVGQYAQVTRTSSDSTVGFTQTVSVGGAGVNGFAVGDKVAFTGIVDAAITPGGAFASIYAQFLGGAQPVYLYPCHSMAFDVTRGRFHAEGVVTTGTTSINVQLLLGANAAGNTTQTRLGFAQVGIFNLTRLGIA